jgi:5-formyltetrahydrofolate cyclo-ligase
MLEKEVLRQMLRDRRWSLSSRDREKMSRAICSHLRDVVAESEEVMVYCAKEPEVETFWFIRYLIDSGIPVVVPIIQKHDTSLRLSYLEDTASLVQSTFRVPEPIGSEIPADPQDVTSAVIPMLGYDLSGGRLGYGAGYYDRFLSENRHIRTIGIAYSIQETEKVPVDVYDIGMDVIINENRTLKFNLEKK